MSNETWQCNEHGTWQRAGAACPACLQAFHERTPADQLTGEERAAIMRRLALQVTIPFDDLHRWVEELVGRPVWTHEMSDWDALVDEARSQQQIGLADVLAKVPWDKPAIVVDPVTGETTVVP